MSASRPPASDERESIAARRHAEATQRNREPILRVLEQVLPRQGRVLEVASGTGEHVTHFAARLPRLQWQPSDVDPQNLASIRGWTTFAGLDNVAPPLTIDVQGWAVATAPASALAAGSFEAVFCANLIHIAPWSACLGLMKLANHVLPSGGVLITYGPYRIDGLHTAPSNARFDQWLKASDPRFGVRDLGEVTDAARACSLELVDRTAMPANNFCLRFERA